MRRTLTAVLLGLVGMALSAPAQARNKARPVIRLDEQVVHGRRQVPRAFYLLQRAPPSFEALEGGESRLGKVVESVDRAPF